jgi:hypothetical protein
LVEHWFLRVNTGGVLQYNDLPDYAAVRTGPTHAFPGQIYVEYTRSSTRPPYDRTGTVFETEHYDLGSDPAQVGSVHANPSYDAARAALAPEIAELATCRGAGCAQAEDR